MASSCTCSWTGVLLLHCFRLLPLTLCFSGPVSVASQDEACWQGVSVAPQDEVCWQGGKPLRCISQQAQHYSLHQDLQVHSPAT